MIVVNFSHPLTEGQCAKIGELAKKPVHRLIEVPVHFDHDQPFEEQVATLVESTGLTSTEWQQSGILVNPPAFAPGAVALTAYLHGLMGHFPTMIRIRPQRNDVYSVYEVGELIRLDGVRELSRTQRNLGS